MRNPKSNACILISRCPGATTTKATTATVTNSSTTFDSTATSVNTTFQPSICPSDYEQRPDGKGDFDDCFLQGTSAGLNSVRMIAIAAHIVMDHLSRKELNVHPVVFVSAWQNVAMCLISKISQHVEGILNA